MESVIDPNPAEWNSAFRQLSSEFGDISCLAGNNGRPRAIDRPYGNTSTARGDDRLHLRHGKRNGKHGTRSAANGHGFCALADYACCFFEVQRTRHVSSSCFTHAVSNNRGGRDAPFGPKSSQRDLNGKNGRLGYGCVVQLAPCFVSRQLVDQGPSDVAFDKEMNLFQLRPEDRLVLHEFASHLPPLRSLPAKHKDRPSRVLFQGAAS